MISVPPLITTENGAQPRIIMKKMVCGKIVPPKQVSDLYYLCNRLIMTILLLFHVLSLTHLIYHERERGWYNVCVGCEGTGRWRVEGKFTMPDMQLTYN